MIPLLIDQLPHSAPVYVLEDYDIATAIKGTLIKMRDVFELITPTGVKIILPEEIGSRYQVYSSESSRIVHPFIKGEK